ncbi:cell wall-associated NlpC family hydrolase [Tamaricihabitans halophyticus]|uniref:Cell wall-associated NlpC family hydrolase n=1 Tax=Tamaricihabitans halophyticus TaxID=1262583 RepID=A0A4R2QN24_9PSEU|nr:NlpC/P60 family protein [Tamaricihabitans halophyticus]TCP50847.1 cell wall-associated NlpC family hydrolase [Tamaricihabitans halophyticus]
MRARNGEQGPARSRRTSGFGRLAVLGAASLAVLLGATGTASAVPPPPPNPSDSELEESRQEANTQASRVGQLTNRLAEAESRLVKLQTEVAVKLEDAEKARVDLQTARSEAEEAKRLAGVADREAKAANANIRRAYDQVDEFVAGSYQQGSTVGSVSAYLSADSPKDLLARADMLESVSSDQLNGLEAMERARTEKANKDSTARAALQRAERAQTTAEQAKVTADNARQTAIEARESQRGRTSEVEAEKREVEQQLHQARLQAGGLEAQRARYEEWQAAKAQEEAEAAAAAAQQQAAAPQASSQQAAAPSGGSGSAPPPAASGGIESVIARGMSQLGVPYSWGGGNANGPTIGVRDGGVADSYGDYMKVGFDCSGLMVYAFAAVGVPLPKYSGYQYTAGQQVPVSQMQRGDMIFWPGHVALYLGNGQMLEAPYSGSQVRVAPVRYGGMRPYAVRML